MKNYFIIFSLLAFHLSISQITIDQNGIGSTVTNEFSANDLQARRYKIAEIGFNSHHWQRGSYMMVELFQTSFSSGYEKYIIQIGYEEGAQQTSPNIYLVEGRGLRRYAKITLGEVTELSTSRSGYINKKIAIYADVRYYSRYKAKITYLRNKVEQVKADNEIKIFENPSGIDIPDFQLPEITSTQKGANLRIDGEGEHYILNGNVGIGTTNPAAKLHVEGNGIRAHRFSTSNVNDRINDSPWYGLGRSNYTGLSNNNNSNAVQLAGYYGLLLKTGKGSLGIHENGNVGIGTTTPDAKLTVKGNIHTQEVKVDLNGAVAPDYVFKEDYKLKSLQEVETFIKKEGHLPNIPSALEMEKEGVNLKEMNLKLLEKIEELTLYTVQQEKDIAAQKEKNKNLEKRLEKLEQVIQVKN